MRPIKHKAKRLDNGKWVEGLVYDIFNEKAGKLIYFINEHSFEGASLDYPHPTYQCIEHEVDPETICIKSNIADDNDILISESDIVQLGNGSIAQIIFSDNHAAFMVRDEFGGYQLLHEVEVDTQITVIGNRFDNPELLNVKP